MNIKPVILSQKVNTEGKTNIKIRIIHQRKSREIATAFYIEPNQWDELNCRVNLKKHPNAAFINAELKKTVLNYEQKLLLEPHDSWTVEKVLKFLKEDKTNSDRFYNYFEKFIARKKTENKRTAEIYQDSLNKIKTLILDTNPQFIDISVATLRDLESKMQSEGLKTNTISIHLKNIRAVFNAAIDEEIIGQEIYPFRRLTIKNEVGSSKALTIDQIKSIRDMNEFTGLQTLARDMFMLSLYLIGMNNGDMYAIDKISPDGRIKYARAKTHRHYNIKVEPEAYAIIERNRGEKKLLSLADRYGTTKAVNGQLNKALKPIGQRLGITNLTMYHARHSWATIAAGLEIPKETISAALGHGGNTVTDIYISFDTRKIDEANYRVIKAISI